MRVRTPVAAITVVTVVAGIGLYVAWRVFGGSLPLRLPVAEGCVVTADRAEQQAEGAQSATPTRGPVDLDAEQMANAATISAVGIRRAVPQRAVVIALATALQESKLRNLSAGDRDSIGLFQQRPSQGWGTPDQIADPRYAAGKFYTSLLKVRGWQQMRVTEAAQKVQRSKYPEAYEKWADDSEVLARALGGDVTAAVACTVVDEPAQRGASAAAALADGVRLDWGEIRTAAGSDVVGVALVAGDQRAGWQYAHWLVAHAAGRGIRRVQFGDRVWTAKGGSWGRVTTSGAKSGANAEGAATERVVAEVYAAS